MRSTFTPNSPSRHLEFSVRGSDPTETRSLVRLRQTLELSESKAAWTAEGLTAGQRAKASAFNLPFRSLTTAKLCIHRPGRQDTQRAQQLDANELRDPVVTAVLRKQMLENRNGVALQTPQVFG